MSIGPTHPSTRTPAIRPPAPVMSDVGPRTSKFSFHRRLTSADFQRLRHRRLFSPGQGRFDRCAPHRRRIIQTFDGTSACHALGGRHAERRMSVWRDPIRDRWPCRRSVVLSLRNVPQGSRYSVPGTAFGSKIILSLCSRRGLVDELPLIRRHDQEVLPGMRLTDR